MKTADEWLKYIQSSEVETFFRCTYGSDEFLLEERRRAFAEILGQFARSYGEDARALVARVPGRINLMGRHVDHRGGHVNPIALNLEILVVAEPRGDDRIVASNIESDDFPARAFSIQEESPRELLRDTETWDRWTLDRWRERQAQGTAKDWGNYLKAAATYFQNQSNILRDRRPLRGMNLMVGGNIPRSAGLASSSALFIACAQTMLRINAFSLPDRDFVEHCGWGEWYVGTRGGMGDHAAIQLARSGQISHIGFWPFSIQHLPFPEGYQVVIANSREEAHKAGNARDRFNQCVACYEIGLMLLREQFRVLAPKMERLRDINSSHLEMSDADIRLMLLQLPAKATRDELRAMLPSSLHLQLDEILARHAEPADGYRIRDVCLFGVAECDRSRRCFSILNRGDVNAFGELMRISHHGDRVVAPAPWSNIHDEFPADPARNHMPLYCQPGAYACSTPQIDEMIDLTMSAEGVVGAQISGAGLGGCIMALVRQDSVERLRNILIERYYRPRGLQPDVHPCVPVAGSSVVEFPEG